MDTHLKKRNLYVDTYFFEMECAYRYQIDKFWIPQNLKMDTQLIFSWILKLSKHKFIYHD